MSSSLYGPVRAARSRSTAGWPGAGHVSVTKGLQRFGEAKLLLRKTLPVARRVRGDSHGDTLRMSWIYAEVLYQDPSATLDDLREAVTTLEDTAPTARRVLGIAHPITKGIEDALQKARAARDANETPPGSA